ncbi:MAG: hypothetical protein EOP53_16775, partial [Sphingobacteriales bacterium]
MGKGKQNASLFCFITPRLYLAAYIITAKNALVNITYKMMQTQVQYKGKKYLTNLAESIDISIPVGRNHGPEAFYLQQAGFITVEAGGFIGNVARGGSCNVENICFNAHGNGTHT